MKWRSTPRYAAILAVAALTTVLAAAGSSREFEDLRTKAMAAWRGGRWEDSKQFWEKAHAMAPDSFQPLEALAAIAAHLGQTDEAFTWLEKAYLGTNLQTSNLEDDESFSVLHSDPRWDALISKLKAENEQAAARFRDFREVDLDPLTAAPFKSLRKLAAEFDRRTEDVEKERWRLSLKEYTAQREAIREQRIAAAHRYLNEHPKAHDRGDAAWDLVQTRVGRWYASALYYPNPGPFNDQRLGEIDAFLRDYPGDPHAGQASLVRAFVAFGGRPKNDTEQPPWLPEELEALETDLGATASKFAGTTAGGLALAWKLIVANLSAVDAVTDEMRSLKAELDQRYGRDREVQRLLVVEGRAAILRMASLDGFEGTDLSGAHWTTASFKGQVTLVDFWATWCGPCVGELPTIKKAWAQYHDKGLRVLGVSLDFDDRATFEGWLKRNNVSWPQLWDGKGFATPMAMKYSVRSIPFTVLLDRDGRVAAAGLRGSELLDRIGKLIGASSEPTVAVAPVVH